MLAVSGYEPEPERPTVLWVGVAAIVLLKQPHGRAMAHVQVGPPLSS